MTFNTGTGFSCGVVLLYGLKTSPKGPRLFEDFVRYWANHANNIYTWSDVRGGHGEELYSQLRGHSISNLSETPWRTNPIPRSDIRVYTLSLSKIGRERLSKIHADLFKADVAKPKPLGW